MNNIDPQEQPTNKHYIIDLPIEAASTCVTQYALSQVNVILYYISF